MTWVVLCALAGAAAVEPPPVVVPTFEPCAATPPSGMKCIPGGAAIVGNDDGPKNERPRRTVQISTFYLDEKEVTNAQYQACVDAGACKPLSIPAYNAKIMKTFIAPEQPAVPVDYARAVQVCAWAGKRLPTEWEWEKAARGAEGALYPWGNDPPSCDKAQFRECAPKGCKPYPGKTHAWDCVEHATKPVGSFPPGHYGLYDMAGNGFEWTSSWAGELPSGACTDCTGVDPTGPCGATDPCSKGGGKKVLRGGSWYWPQDQTRGSFRRVDNPLTKEHRLSARCASATAALAGFPTQVGSTKRPPPATPPPPSEEHKKAAHAIKQDELTKQECGEKGRSFIDCRDPTSYIRSNEPRQHVWRPYIENLGGGYTGVGIDQNYSFIALQKAEWAWLFDYDPTVVRLHYVLRAMILAAPDRKQFAEMFHEDNKAEGLKLLSETYKKDPERAAYREVFAISRKSLLAYYERQLDGTKDDASFGWLASDAAYTYVRTLFQQDRIVILKGDMLANRTMQGIAKAARAVGTTIRVYYPSNAPECWPHTAQYKRNVMALPFDEQTVILQTLSGNRPGIDKERKGYWHYNVQSGLDQQRLMKRKGIGSLKQLVMVRNAADDPDLSVTGLARAP